MRAKKLTREQRQLLQSEQITDTENWVYVKTQHIACDGSKKVSHNSPKLIQYIFENIHTGQQVAISKV